MSVSDEYHLIPTEEKFPFISCKVYHSKGICAKTIITLTNRELELTSDKLPVSLTHQVSCISLLNISDVCISTGAFFDCDDFKNTDKHLLFSIHYIQNS